MSLRNLLHRLTRPQPRRIAGNQHLTARRNFLRFERLEDRTVLAQEMNVVGNGVSIVDGDTTPDAGDFTDFGSLAVTGGVLTRSFTIQNTGDAALSLTGGFLGRVQITSGQGFSVSTQPSSSTVAAAGSLTFSIRFDPSNGGLSSATVTIPNNDTDENPYNFVVQGVGTGAREINVRGNGVSIPDSSFGLPSAANHTDFGVAELSGQTVTRTFTIENPGDQVLQIDGISIGPALAFSAPGDFSLSGLPAFPATIPAGGNITFDVTFDPSDDTIRAAQIVIENDDANEDPYNINISGLGLVGTVQATLTGGVLTIADIHATGRDNSFFVTELGDNLIVADLLSLESFTFDSTTNTGGTFVTELSDILAGIIDLPAGIPTFNKVLSIPKAGINSIVFNGNGGNDTFTTGLFLSFIDIALNGGDGNDDFGALLPLIPSIFARIAVDGGLNTAGGDEINIDLSTVFNVIGPVTLGTNPTTGITSASSLLFRSFTYTNVEAATLIDNNFPTNFAQGDLYVRGTAGNDNYEIKPGTLANTGRLSINGSSSGTTYAIPGKVILYGRGGNDKLKNSYTGHSSELYGEAGNDVLTGNASADKLVGGIGNDELVGGDGNNLLWGDNDPVAVGLADNAANRELLANDISGPGSAHHATGSFNDKIKSGIGADEVYGGPGNDGSSTTMDTGDGDDYFHGGTGNDKVNLGKGNDRAYGGTGNDTLSGGDGYDFLGGGDGNDTLTGGNGNDVLVGGLGTDNNNGNSGTDRVFQENVSVTVNVNALPLLPPVAAVPYTGTAESRRKGDINDQAMAELIFDWQADGAINAANLLVVTDGAVATN